MDLVGKENEIPNHVPLQHKPIVAARYSYIKEGCKLNLDDLPPELAVATRKDSKTGKVSNYSHVYKRWIEINLLQRWYQDTMHFQFILH